MATTMTLQCQAEAPLKENEPATEPSLEKPQPCSFIRPNLIKEITKQVIRKKLLKQRHLILDKAIDAAYLDSLFPRIIELFKPQTVYYNGGVAQVPEWKISCYLEVMEGGVPTAAPNLQLRDLMSPLLEQCNELFLHWYKQQHACNHTNGCKSRLSHVAQARLRENSQTSTNDTATSQQSPSSSSAATSLTCNRLMTFITRYTPAPGEQALLKHVDGAGKVDGSIVVALPMEVGKEFHGGGLTVWDGKADANASGRTLETHYETRSGDLVFLDRAVWHQADPITKGTRWALVIFYKVQRE